LDVFNIRQALLAEKNNYLLYPVSSGDLSHYTQMAAFFTYFELMKHINIYFPNIVPFELNDIIITYDENKLPQVYLGFEKTYKKLDESFFDVYFLNKNLRDFNAVFENTDPDLPIILLFRDSFADEGFITKYIAQHFGKTIMTHWLNIEHFHDFVNRINPDIILFETIDRDMSLFANIIFEIPELQ
jgi:hypothetical protein